MALVFDFKSIKSRFDILGFEYICTKAEPPKDLPQEVNNCDPGPIIHITSKLFLGPDDLNIACSMRTWRPSVWRIYELMNDKNDLIIGAKNA